MKRNWSEAQSVIQNCNDSISIYSNVSAYIVGYCKLYNKNKYDRADEINNCKISTDSREWKEIVKRKLNVVIDWITNTNLFLLPYKLEYVVEHFTTHLTS